MKILKPITIFLLVKKGQHVTLRLKFCTCYTIEVEQAGSSLGYIPHAFSCINENGAYLQAPGEIQIKIDDGLWRREIDL